MKLFVALISFVFLSISCAGQLEQNIEELDAVYGKCDNPQRNIKDNDNLYKICKAKERAATDKIDLDDISLTDFFNRSGEVVYQYTANPELWAGALEATQKYPLKIADIQGGIIETEWIYDNQNTNQRCAIKIRITSQELISTGAKTNLNCENFIDGEWFPDQLTYTEEEKAITLKILENAKKS